MQIKNENTMTIKEQLNLLRHDDPFGFTSDLEFDEFINRFIEFINQPNCTYIKKNCGKPIFLKNAFLNYQSHPIDSIWTIGALGALYYRILCSFIINYLNDFKIFEINFYEMSTSCLIEYSSEELNFLEFISFNLIYLDKIKFKSTDINANFLKNIDNLLHRSECLGFIEKCSQDEFQFTYNDFQYFFAARYIISCLQTSLGFKNISYQSHVWNTNITGYKTVEEYMYNKIHSRSEEYKFIEMILTYEDGKILLDYCSNQLKENKQKMIEENRAFIAKLRDLNFTFGLIFEKNKLIISITDCSNSSRLCQMRNFDTFIAMLTVYLKANQLFDGVTLTEDPEEDILTITSIQKNSIYHIHNWLILITDGFVSELPKKYTPSLSSISFWSKEYAGKNLDVKDKIECRLS